VDLSLSLSLSEKNSTQKSEGSICDFDLRTEVRELNTLVLSGICDGSFFAAEGVSIEGDCKCIQALM
jgi:hypothetical protein